VSDSAANDEVISSLVLKGKEDYGRSVLGGGPEVVLEVPDLVVYVF